MFRVIAIALLGCSGWLYSKCLAAWLVGWAALTIGLGGAEARGPSKVGALIGCGVD